MKMTSIIEQFGDEFIKHYDTRLLPSHRRTLDAIMACRSQCGEAHFACNNCSSKKTVLLSCGNRHCPSCQNRDTTAWIERQKQKLLPVSYFMVTFTLPRELRQTAWQHQREIYELLFKAAVKTLRKLGLDKKHLGAELGMTGVLHTHTRQLDYHPHIHFIVPGGGLTNNGKSSLWKKLKDKKYFIRGDVIARVFRGKFLEALIEAGIPFPSGIPTDWVVHCKHMGHGKGAIEYLSRYLYRGVISEHRIIKKTHEEVTFSYIDSATKKPKQKTLKGADFIWHFLMHVLPRGFRRVRDFGFLHPNAKKRLRLIQLILQVHIEEKVIERKAGIVCPICRSMMQTIIVLAKRIPLCTLFHPQKKPREVVT